MTLKDRLNDALAATPAENTRRRDTLRAALNAGDVDTDIEAAFRRLIDAREQRAASQDRSGRPDLAQAEREEIDELRRLLGAQGGTKPTKGAKSGRLGKLTIARTPAIIIAAAGLVALGAVLFFVLRPSQDTADTLVQSGEKIRVFKDDRTMGDPNAPITMLEYAAPVCPFCARFATTAMPGIKRDYIDTGKVFYIFRVYPLRAQDGAVEGIARCLPADRYFAYIDRMFRAQPQWDPDGHDIPDPESAIAGLAVQEGLSVARIQQCMHDPNQMARINEVAGDGQLRYGIDHTPFFVVNGVVVNIPPEQDAAMVIRLRLDSLLAMKQ
jgi:protein-disulfide isomerase